MSRRTTLASVSARTSPTPHPRSTRAHASSVAPVVATSSTSTTQAPCSASPLALHPLHPCCVRAGANTPRTFPWRCAAGRPVWGGVATVRRSAWTTGGPRCAASSVAWLKPRARRRRGWSGTGTTQSASASRSVPCRRIKAPSGAASVWRRSYLKRGARVDGGYARRDRLPVRGRAPTGCGGSGGSARSAGKSRARTEADRRINRTGGVSAVARPPSMPDRRGRALVGRAASDRGGRPARAGPPAASRDLNAPPRPGGMPCRVRVVEARR